MPVVPLTQALAVYVVPPTVGVVVPSIHRGWAFLTPVVAAAEALLRTCSAQLPSCPSPTGRTADNLDVAFAGASPVRVPDSSPGLTAYSRGPTGVVDEDDDVVLVDVLVAVVV